MKRSSVIKHNKRLKRRKNLNRVSSKQKARLLRYYPIQAKFLKENKWCMVCALTKGRPVPSSEVHHSRGRNGSLLFDTRFFVATCRSCRMVPHLNPKWAREVGILAPPHEWGVVPRNTDVD